MKNNKTQQCSCEVVDFFAYLPPEMRPRPKKHSSLRKVTCPYMRPGVLDQSGYGHLF